MIDLKSARNDPDGYRAALARKGAGELAYEDVKLRIRASLSDQLAIKHFVDQLKRQTYIDIRL